MNLRDIFPEMKEQHTLDYQIRKIFEELKEAEIERSVDAEKFLCEMIDVMHATAGALYVAGYTDEEISEGIKSVIHKNKERGYYKDETRRNR